MKIQQLHQEWYNLIAVTQYEDSCVARPSLLGVFEVGQNTSYYDQAYENSGVSDVTTFYSEATLQLQDGRLNEPPTQNTGGQNGELIGSCEDYRGLELIKLRSYHLP